MRTRHTMTLLLVLTLLTNLAHHERGSVTASGEVEKSELTSKRRMLERLIRQGLASSDRNQLYSQSTSQQHLYPASPLEVPSAAGKTFRPLGSSLLEWFRSNHIPSNNNWGQEEEPPPERTHNSSSIVGEMTNYFLPLSEDNPKSLPLLMRQYELSEDLEDSMLHRRHAAAGVGSSAKDRRQQRQKRRKEKKKKRNKAKRRRRKEDKRLEEVLNNKNVTLHNIDGEEYLDCCPSKQIVVEKKVGKDRYNYAVEISPSQQYFYERGCLPGIEKKECIFPARSLRKGVVTRCAQQFSYVQAQVRRYKTDGDWKLDYILVKSGCSCQVSVSPRKKKNKKIK